MTAQPPPAAPACEDFQEVSYDGAVDVFFHGSKLKWVVKRAPQVEAFEGTSVPEADEHEDADLAS